MDLFISCVLGNKSDLGFQNPLFPCDLTDNLISHAMNDLSKIPHISIVPPCGQASFNEVQIPEMDIDPIPLLQECSPHESLCPGFKPSPKILIGELLCGLPLGIVFRFNYVK